MIIKVLGAVLCGVGLVWILQGVGVLPGSFMTGQVVWAAIGGLALIVGLMMLFARRSPRRGPGATTSGDAQEYSHVHSDTGGDGAD